MRTVFRNMSSENRHPYDNEEIFGGAFRASLMEGTFKGKGRGCREKQSAAEIKSRQKYEDLGSLALFWLDTPQANEQKCNEQFKAHISF